MNRPRGHSSRDRSLGAFYLVLCVVMVAVGWTIGVAVAPVGAVDRSPGPTVSPTPLVTTRVDPTPTVVPTLDPSAAAPLVPKPDASPTKAPVSMDLYRPEHGQHHRP